jgi:hypothetical protein
MSGEVFGLLGGNGAGKTVRGAISDTLHSLHDLMQTLMSIMTNDYLPSSGVAYVEHRNNNVLLPLFPPQLPACL